MNEQVVMIQAAGETEQLRRVYNRKSRHYARTLAPLERKARMRGLELGRIRPGERVLEVAVGTGETLVEIARQVGREQVVHGVDLSPGMLAKAGQAVAAAGLSNVKLAQADARRLPFPDGSFDLLFNSYMLDLIKLEEMPLVLGEFNRVLRPGGRLVLVNMSKAEPMQLTWFERFYRVLPQRLVPHLIGACRPVVMGGHVAASGFVGTTREFLGEPWPSEVILARKP